MTNYHEKLEYFISKWKPQVLSCPVLHITDEELRRRQRMYDEWVEIFVVVIAREGIRFDLSCKIEKFWDPQTVRQKRAMDSSPNDLLRRDLRNHGGRFPISLAHPEQLFLDRSSALDYRPTLRSL